MLCAPVDPEQPKPLAHIWRRLYCNMYLRKNEEIWGITEDQVIDTGYCLDRYSLNDAIKE